MYLLIKYIKSVLWRVAKRLSYIVDARCLKINSTSLGEYTANAELLNDSLRSFTDSCILSFGTQSSNWVVHKLILLLKPHSVPHPSVDYIAQYPVLDLVDPSLFSSLPRHPFPSNSKR